MKRFKQIIVVFLIILTLTGCFKKDKMDNIDIYVTNYPIYYLMDSIYGYNSNIKSIYPNGVNISEYELTDKQLEKYAKSNLFAYNGLSNEKNLAVTFLNKNKNIKLVDATFEVPKISDENELWLNPSIYGIMAENIKNGLLTYIGSTITKQEVEKNYDNVKLVISKYEATIHEMSKNTSNNTIIVGNDSLKFLNKFGFNVLTIKDSEDLDVSEFNIAKRNIQNKTNKYVFILDTDIEDKNVLDFQNQGATIIKIKTMMNLSKEQIQNGEDYVTIMDEFIENLKSEVYKS